MPAEQPNILVVLTDQQSASMMSCAGNAYLRTPAMDSLAARGTRFDRAYCSNPVCVPSRFSLFTGRLPSEIGLRSNQRDHIDGVPEPVRKGGLGWQLRSRGYETAYAGKQHLLHMEPADLGFERVVTTDDREGLAPAAATYLQEPRERPFLLVASLVNPHDICYMAIRDCPSERHRSVIAKNGPPIQTLDRALALPDGMDEETFFATRCPPLPPNLEPPADEPEAIREAIARSAFRTNARNNWSDERWRMHRWAYARLTEIVDEQIGGLLSALDASGHAANTVVVFTSDHGDHDGAHRLEHKSTFYEEAIRVPMIVAPPDHSGAPRVDGTHLVSSGLDLLPTLCDYAGAETPPGLAGMSLRPLVEGHADADWRTVLPVECALGRMVRTDRYKYMRYDPGENWEQLIDLEGDPFEMRNAVGDPACRQVLETHRAVFDATFAS